MAQVPLIAKINCYYNGRIMQPGERFDAACEHAQVLKLMGCVVDATMPVQPLPEEATIQPLTADDPPKRKRGRPRKIQTTEESPRTYQRRDMEPEP